MKFYEYHKRSEIKQMRVFALPEKPLHSFAQVTIHMCSIRVPVLVDGRSEMRLPSETTIADIQKLPIYSKEE
jgi:hypothetical protein